MEPNKQITVKQFFDNQSVKAKFDELLGKNAPAFMTSVLQIVNSNALLQKAEPMSVFNAAATAATLNLPINNNLGFAYIVPYKTKQKDGSWSDVAQFQIGYKGFIQLAQRSGLFKRISSTPVYSGQVVKNNPLTGYEFDFDKKESDTVVGYAAYFELLSGFEATLYMTKEEVSRHGKKYSKTFENGTWKTDFDAMATKTVIKLLLSKYAPLSIETTNIQKAIITDQAIINNVEATDVTYVDNDQNEAATLFTTSNAEKLDGSKQD